MKILSTKRYKDLIFKEKHLDTDKGVIFEISSLISVAHGIFSENNGEEIKDFITKLNKLALLIGEVLDYEVALFGYKDDNKLIDLKIYYKGKEVANNDLEDLKSIDFDQSMVGKIIKEKNSPFIFESKKGSKILDYKSFSKNHSELDISRVDHDNLKSFFSFLETDLENLIVCPITPTNLDYTSTIGYLILANKKQFVLENERTKVDLLKSYLYQIFKNQTGLINRNRDSSFISKIFAMHFVNGIKEVLKYFVDEFNFHYSSFWVPTKVESNTAFGLKECYLQSDDESIKKDCISKDFYKENEIILGEIYNAEIEPTLLGEYYLFNNWKTHEKAFVCAKKYFEEKAMLIVPISKYIHQSEEEIEKEKKENKNKHLGYFCFYLNQTENFQIEYSNRLNNFIQQISFYIEHILYDNSFHVTRLVRDKIFNLDISDFKSYYNNLVNYVNHIMNSEHTSIYFINKNKELYLKASTADSFWKMNKELKEPELELVLNELEIINNQYYPIYSNDESITYRCYLNKQTLMIHDVHSKDVKSDLSFYERTKRFHISIIVQPIIVDDECIGVIKCVNKKERKDSFLKIFTNNDFETIGMIGSFVSNQYMKVKSVANQQLFVEKLAHENKTPINVIWSAVENLEFKIKKLSNEDDTLVSNFESISFATSVINNNYSNLSTFLRSQENKLQFHFEVVDLKDKIAEITGFLKPLLQNEENKIVAVQHHLTKMPLMYVDEVKMFQVIYNLLSNAIRYCDSSSIVETFYFEDPLINLGTSQIKYVEIQFKNYGIGIVKGDEFNVFKEYYRSVDAIKKVPNGTGIGLQVAQTIIKGHNGFIEVTRLHKPTIFSIYLPKTILRE